MSNTLILKRISNDFDRYVSNFLDKNLPDVSVKDPYKFDSKIGRKIVFYAKKYNFNLLFKKVLNIKKEEIMHYDNIILFDDYPDINLLKWLNEAKSNAKLHLWFWNVPNYSIETYRKYCNMYCFDRQYSIKNGITFVNQFYFLNEPIIRENKIKFDVSYIGVDKCRFRLLDKIAKDFDKLSINYKFVLVSRFNGSNSNIDYIREHIKYEEVINICNESIAILELVTLDQKGLTLRSLEALFFQKKLITNNKNIAKFDFYNKNNIFIYGVDELESLCDFLNTPYELVPEELIKKYTIKEWYKSIIH